MDQKDQDKKPTINSPEELIDAVNEIGHAYDSMLRRSIPGTWEEVPEEVKGRTPKEIAKDQIRQVSTRAPKTAYDYLRDQGLMDREIHPAWKNIRFEAKARQIGETHKLRDRIAKATSEYIDRHGHQDFKIERTRDHVAIVPRPSVGGTDATPSPYGGADATPRFFGTTPNGRENLIVHQDDLATEPSRTAVQNVEDKARRVITGPIPKRAQYIPTPCGSKNPEPPERVKGTKIEGVDFSINWIPTTDLGVDLEATKEYMDQHIHKLSCGLPPDLLWGEEPEPDEADADVMGELHSAFNAIPEYFGDDKYAVCLQTIDLCFDLDDCDNWWYEIYSDEGEIAYHEIGFPSLTACIDAAKKAAREILTNDLEKVQ